MLQQVNCFDKLEQFILLLAALSQNKSTTQEDFLIEHIVNSDFCTTLEVLDNKETSTLRIMIWAIKKYVWMNGLSNALKVNLIHKCER